MTKKIVSTIVIGLLFCGISFSQNSKESTSNSPGISIGYWGNGSQSKGIFLGYQKNLINTEKYKIITGLDLVFEKMPQNYSSYGLIAKTGVRRTLKSGIFFEYYLRAGYLGSYYPFDLYRVNSEGEVINYGKKVFSTFAFGNSIGIGYDFSYKTKLNLQIFINPILYYRYPNNDNPFYTNNTGIQAGVIFNL